MQRHHDAVIELPFLGIGDVDLIHDIGDQPLRQVRRSRNIGAFDAEPGLILYRPGIGLAHPDTKGGHVVHEEIGEMLGADHDQRLGARILNRLAHPLEALVQPVTEGGVGTFCPARDTRRVAANTCKNQRHLYSPAIA
jgi:hypothetical protein